MMGATADGQPITSARLFDKKRNAKPVRHELRKLCPRNADVINIEPADVGFGPRELGLARLAADRRGRFCYLEIGESPARLDLFHAASGIGSR
jgi:hypothetical protein